jgi:hypothetical protein
VPAHNTPIKASRREALLIAIAKARQWIDDLDAWPRRQLRADCGRMLDAGLPRPQH